MKLIIKNKSCKHVWLTRLNSFLQKIYRDRDIKSNKKEYTRLHNIIEAEMESLKIDNLLKADVEIINNTSEIVLKEGYKIIQIYTIE